MTTPIDIRPSPCPSQAPHGPACKISPPYVAPFPSLSRTDAKATLQLFSRDVYTLCFRKKSPFYFCDSFVGCHSIMPMLGRNIPQGIWNKDILHSPPHLILYVCTVPYNNWQQFLRHTVQRQIWSLHIKIQLSHQVTLTVICKKDCSNFQCKCWKCCPSVFTQVRSHPLVDCLVDNMPLQTRSCSNQAPLQISNVDMSCMMSLTFQLTGFRSRPFGGHKSEAIWQRSAVSPGP